MVSNLGLHPRLLDVSQTPRWLEAPDAGPNGWAFRAERGRTYLAVAAESVLEPAVRIPLASHLRDERNRADYMQ